MNINITKEGRRTNIAMPDWYPRPDGTERAVVFQPGYTAERTLDPRKDFGKHGMEITWYLRGPKGVTYFGLMAGWVPGEKGVPRRLADIFPSGVGMGYHSPTPQFEGQPRAVCTLLPGGFCYCDSSGLAAHDLIPVFIVHGEPAVWAALEGRYEDLTNVP